MGTKKKLKIDAGFLAVFGLVYFLPTGLPRFDNAVQEALKLTRWYAREHVILSLPNMIVLQYHPRPEKNHHLRAAGSPFCHPQRLASTA